MTAGHELELLLPEELMQRERHWDEGGELRNNEQVCVVAARPLELAPEHAAIVRRNMTRGITYHYFFHASADNGANDLALVAQLFKALVEAGAGQHPSLGENVLHLKERLKIHLLAYRPPFEFCVHNALRGRGSACFIQRDDERFVCWNIGAEARTVATCMLKQRSSKAKNGARHLVHETECRRVVSRVRERIVSEINRLFGGRLDKGAIEQHCFGSSASGSAH